MLDYCFWGKKRCCCWRSVLISEGRVSTLQSQRKFNVTHEENVPFVLMKSFAKLLKEVFPGVGIIWRYSVIESGVHAIEGPPSLLVRQDVICCGEGVW